jgi:S1-C subfamily serine protease
MRLAFLLALLFLVLTTPANAVKPTQFDGSSGAPSPTAEDVLGLRGVTAILVGGVDPGLPAERAGLRTSDLILRFNGKDMRAFMHYRSFLESMRQAAFPDGVSLDILRYDPATERYDWRQVELRLETEPDDAHQIYLGIKATPTYFVLEVPDGTQAKRLGLQPGDFVEEVNGKAFVSPGDLDRLLAEVERAPDRHISLWVTRWIPVRNGTVGGKNTRRVEGTLEGRGATDQPPLLTAIEPSFLYTLHAEARAP